MTFRGGGCHGTPLLHAWLLPDLNTKPKNCVVENSLYGYDIGFWCTRSLVRILPGSHISVMHLFICFFVMDFVHKNALFRESNTKTFGYRETSDSLASLHSALIYY